PSYLLVALLGKISKHKGCFSGFFTGLALEVVGKSQTQIQLCLAFVIRVSHNIPLFFDLVSKIKETRIAFWI
ncbi:MAG: hypothetical protein ACYSQY_02820, partial [Planctomycetota bacterium]